MPNEYIYLLYSVNKSKSARMDTKPYLIYSVYIFFKTRGTAKSPERGRTISSTSMNREGQAVGVWQLIGMRLIFQWLSTFLAHDPFN